MGKKNEIKIVTGFDGKPLKRHNIDTVQFISQFNLDNVVEMIPGKPNIFKVIESFIPDVFKDKFNIDIPKYDTETNQIKFRFKFNNCDKQVLLKIGFGDYPKHSLSLCLDGKHWHNFIYEYSDMHV